MVVCLTGFAQSPIEDCKCKDIELYGDVCIVDYFDNPDFVVRVVDPCYVADKVDLYVERLDEYTVANKCGEWSIVKDRNRAKFTVAFVTDRTPDFTIQYIRGREAGMP